MVGCANPVLVDMMGLHCLSAAFSGVSGEAEARNTSLTISCDCSALRGLAALLGPPVAGLVVDLVGDTALPLVMAAGVMLEQWGKIYTILH